MCCYFCEHEVSFQAEQISSSSSSKFMFGNTFCLVLYCFVLVLYHTAFMLNNETCKPDVSIYARQASLV